MRLNDIIYKFLRNPLPLWEAEATIAIIQYKWKELKQTKMLGISDYSTARAYYDCTVPIDGKYYLADFNSNDSMCIESYSASLQGFYNEHGLNLYSDSELKSKQYIKRIESALEIFNLVMPVKICISKLVRTIQVLKQEDMEIDVSYSHPQIPFSIFVSVCDDNSVI